MNTVVLMKLHFCPQIAGRSGSQIVALLTPTFDGGFGVSLFWLAILGYDLSQII